jgi:ankyrin repeat protein
MRSLPLTYSLKFIFLVFFLASTLSFNSYSQEQQGDTSLLGALLSTPDAQANINYALLSASARGDTVQIWWLLRYGAEIETQTWEKVTPLIFAVANNKLDAARQLLSYGADPNARTSMLENPLTLAVKNDNVEMAELLIRDSAIVNSTDRFGATPLHYAALNGFFYPADLLLYYDAKASARSFDGTTPLMAAVWSGNIDVADLLLQNGAKCTERDNNGFSPFLIAAQNGDTVMMNFLLDHGGDLYEMNRFNYNALDLCIKINATGAVKYLLRIGNKWGEKTSKLVSPYAVANIYRRTSLIPVLKEYKILDETRKGFDQVSVSGSFKNCIFDYYTGFSVSLKEPRHNLGIIAGVDFKPGYTRVLMKQGESLYYQYYDKGALAYAGLFKDIPITDKPMGGNWFFTGSLSGGLSFSNRLKGTDIAAGNKFRFMPAAGFKWSKRAFTLNSELEYMITDFYRIGPIWLRIGFSWSFFFDNARAPGKEINWY